MKTVPAAGTLEGAAPWRFAASLQSPCTTLSRRVPLGPTIRIPPPWNAHDRRSIAGRGRLPSPSFSGPLPLRRLRPRLPLARVKAVYLADLADVAKSSKGWPRHSPAHSTAGARCRESGRSAEVLGLVAGEVYFERRPRGKVPADVRARSTRPSSRRADRQGGPQEACPRHRTRWPCPGDHPVEGPVEGPMNMPLGVKPTGVSVLADVIADQHEHRGQLIAYARMNKIVPPGPVRQRPGRAGRGSRSAAVPSMALVSIGEPAGWSSKDSPRSCLPPRLAVICVGRPERKRSPLSRRARLRGLIFFPVEGRYLILAAARRGSIGAGWIGSAPASRGVGGRRLHRCSSRPATSKRCTRPSPPEEDGRPSSPRPNWIKYRMFEVRDPDGHVLWFGQSFQERDSPMPLGDDLARLSGAAGERRRRGGGSPSRCAGVPRQLRAGRHRGDEPGTTSRLIT